MRTRDLIFFGLGALKGHGLRSLLCLLGVSIGVASVLILTSLGEGARTYVIGQFASLGNNLVIVIPGRNETMGVSPANVGVTRDLTLGDVEAIRRQVPQALYVAPAVLGNETIRFERRSRSVPVIGTSREYLQVRQLNVATGQNFQPGNLRGGEPVCLLGPTVSEELFGTENPLGQFVRLGDWRFRVIGVLERKGVALGVNFDDIVLVPVSYSMRMFNTSSLFRVVVESAVFSEVNTTRDLVEEVIVQRHQGELDVTVVTQDAVIESLDDILSILTLAMGGIAGISLAVAGIGVMNVMLVSVSERVSEIGLLRAVGANPGQILGVFLAEAAALSGAGGVLGLILGYGGARLASQMFSALQADVPNWAALAAFAVSLLIGVVFGSIPARNASRLDPVEALRSD